MSRLSRRLALVASLAATVPLPGSAPARVMAWGANLVETPAAPFGSAACGRVLETLARAGLVEVAPVFFLWQQDAEAPAPRAGDIPPGRLAAVLRQAREAGLRVWPKAHLWIPGRWAGAARPPDPSAWLAALASLLLPYVEVAQGGDASGFVIGTELVGVEAAEGWEEVAASVRSRFGGRLAYAAHGVDGVARFRAWHALDEVFVSMWPSLGDDPSPAAMRARIARALQELSAASPAGRTPSLAELGMRSKHGAQAEPWRSPEETAGCPDEALQARAITLWDQEVRRAGLARAWWWCLYTDPEAGGVRDTDFTPQGKAGFDALRAAARGRRADARGA